MLLASRPQYYIKAPADGQGSLTLIGLIPSTASGCIVFASNILVAADHAVSEWAERGIAIGVISFVTLLHTFFPHVGVKLMNVLGTIKIFILAFVVVTGWVVLSGRVHRIPDPHSSFRNSFAGSSHSGYEYSIALFKVLNSYTGYVNPPSRRSI